MSKISFLEKESLSNYSNTTILSSLKTKEDVATLLDTFEDATSKVPFDKIEFIVKDSDNFYYCVTSDKGGFDLFSFIEKSYPEKLNLSSVNVRLLFPKELSRGVCSDDLDDDDDAPTSFLSEDMISDKKVTYSLNYRSHGITVEIPKKGIVIGRSIKKSDFIVKDNGNVGRAHCRVYINDEGKLMVHDLESLNGTFVNNVKVSPSRDVQLRIGDTLILADEEFDVQ